MIDCVELNSVRKGTDRRKGGRNGVRVEGREERSEGRREREGKKKESELWDYR